MHSYKAEQGRSSNKLGNHKLHRLAVDLQMDCCCVQVAEPASLPPLMEPEVKTAPQPTCYSVEANSLVFSKPVKVGRDALSHPASHLTTSGGPEDTASIFQLTAVLHGIC